MRKPPKSASARRPDERDVVARMLEMVEQEHRRIARELKDGLCQKLAGIALMGLSLEERLRREQHPVTAKLKRCRQEILSIIDETRRLALALSSAVLESEGLPAALQALASETDRPGQCHCRFVCRREIVIDDATVATHLFRIAQEAVNIALRHRRAASVQMILEEEDGTLVLTVRDNGSGGDGPKPEFDAELDIMRYRAGLLGGKLASGPAAAGGTVVVCRVPLPRSGHEA